MESESQRQGFRLLSKSGYKLYTLYIERTYIIQKRGIRS